MARLHLVAVLAALLAAAPLVANGQAITSSYIHVGSNTKIFQVVSDCHTLWGTIGLTLKPLVWTFLNYSCEVPTGNSLPSIIRLTLNYNATLGNPNNGPAQDAGYLANPANGGFQAFVNALGPLCTSEALYIDTYRGAPGNPLITACTPDRNGKTQIFLPGTTCTQALTSSGCVPPSPPPPSPPTAPCPVRVTVARPNKLYDPNCYKTREFTSLYFTSLGQPVTATCVDDGSQSGAVVVESTVPAGNVYGNWTQYLIANTRTANYIIDNLDLSCAGTIAVSSPCGNFVISQSSVPAAFAAPVPCRASPPTPPAPPPSASLVIVIQLGTKLNTYLAAYPCPTQVTLATAFFASNGVAITGLVCNTDSYSGNSVLSAVSPSDKTTAAATLLASAAGAKSFAQALTVPCGTPISAYNSFTGVTSTQTPAC